jgi:hypothetical protein
MKQDEKMIINNGKVRIHSKLLFQALRRPMLTLSDPPMLYQLLRLCSMKQDEKMIIYNGKVRIHSKILSKFKPGTS